MVIHSSPKPPRLPKHPNFDLMKFLIGVEDTYVSCLLGDAAHGKAPPMPLILNEIIRMAVKIKQIVDDHAARPKDEN